MTFSATQVAHRGSISSPMRWLSGVLAAALALGRLSGAQTSKVSEQPKAVPGKFLDLTLPLGVRFQHLASHTSKKYLPETMGGGVALFDYDNDGRLDVFFVNGARIADPMPPGGAPDKSD